MRVAWLPSLKAWLPLLPTFDLDLRFYSVHVIGVEVAASSVAVMSMSKWLPHYLALEIPIVTLDRLV